MSAVIPSKDEAANEKAFDQVKRDKSREAGDGFDGSWVAHPGMVATCKDVFTEVLGENPNGIVVGRAGRTCRTGGVYFGV